ncbi:MAG: SpoIIE family protein phosphatase [Turneriella sp.]
MKRIARDAFTFGVLLLLPGWLAAEPVITIHASGLPAIAAGCDYKTSDSPVWVPARELLNLGLVAGQVVLRCRITNPGSGTPVILEIASPWIDRMEMTFPGSGIAWLAGELVPGELRQLQSRNPAFRLPLKSGDNQLELQVQANGSAVFLPMRIVSEQQFELSARRDYTLFGAYFGALLILALVATVFGIYSRDVIFFPYALGIFSGSVYFFIEYGLPGSLLGVASPYLNVGLGISSALTFALFTDFHRRFLQAIGFRSAILFRTICLVAVGTGLLFLFLPYAFCIKLLNYTILLGEIVIFAYFVKQIRHSKYPLAYSMAWLVFIVSTFLSVLAKLNLVSAGLLVRHNVSAAFFLQAVLFSMVIGSRHKEILIEGFNTRTALNLVEQELSHAQEIHRRILPRPDRLPARPLLDVHYTPLGRLGGDFYTFEERADTGIIFFIADVQGHGLPAALDASSVKVAFQQSVTRQSSAATILSDINRHLSPHLDSRFVSAQVVCWHPQTHQVEIASAGHPYPIVCSNSGMPCREIVIGGPILGLAPDFVYQGTLLALQPGEFLLVYTDGLIEDPSSHRTYEEDREILMAAFSQSVRLPKPAAELAARVLRYHTAGQFSDDVTVMVFCP